MNERLTYLTGHLAAPSVIDWYGGRLIMPHVRKSCVVRTVTMVCHGPSHERERKFSYDPTAKRKGYPGMCDECNEQLAEDESAAVCAEIEDLATSEPGHYIFIPATIFQPCPWESYEAVVERLNQKLRATRLTILEIHQGDEPDRSAMNTEKEEEDGARIWVN